MPRWRTAANVALILLAAIWCGWCAYIEFIYLPRINAAARADIERHLTTQK